MPAFVRFTVTDRAAFAALCAVFEAIAAVKNARGDHDVDALRSLMPAAVRDGFDWPEGQQLDDTRLPRDRPVRIAAPGSYSGERWAFVRVLDLIDVSDYALEECVLTGEQVGELRVEPGGYPYGGLNALIALVEGFGFPVLGFDEGSGYVPAPDS